MTTNKMIEDVHNAILEASDGYMSNPEVAKAAITAMQPYVQELVGVAQHASTSLRFMSDDYAIGFKPDDAMACGILSDQLKKALSSLSAEWNLCEHHWVGGGSDTFRSVHCAKCGAAHKDNFSQVAGR